LISFASPKSKMSFVFSRLYPNGGVPPFQNPFLALSNILSFVLSLVNSLSNWANVSIILRSNLPAGVEISNLSVMEIKSIFACSKNSIS
jgi:hypothetical protein